MREQRAAERGDHAGARDRDLAQAGGGLVVEAAAAGVAKSLHAAGPGDRVVDRGRRLREGEAVGHGHQRLEVVRGLGERQGGVPVQDHQALAAGAGGDRQRVAAVDHHHPQVVVREHPDQRRRRRRGRVEHRQHAPLVVAEQDRGAAGAADLGQDERRRVGVADAAVEGHRAGEIDRAEPLVVGHEAEAIADGADREGARRQPAQAASAQRRTEGRTGQRRRLGVDRERRGPPTVADHERRVAGERDRALAHRGADRHRTAISQVEAAVGGAGHGPTGVALRLAGERGRGAVAVLR